MRAGRISNPAKTLLLLLLGLGYIQAKDVQAIESDSITQEVTTPDQNTIQHIPSDSNTNATHKNHYGFFNLATSAVGSLMENVEHIIDDILPVDLDESSVFSGGGFGDDGTTLAWGSSTLEVVKTQASYLTRAAAFGPRIVDEQGLRGTLLPISDFYRISHKDGQEVAKENIEKQLAINNLGCPYKGGPGWRDDDDEENGSMTDPEKIIVEKVTAKPPSDWIALVERGGNCSFVAKVRVAQALGAEAVVVGDAPSENGGRDGQTDNDPGLSGQLVTMYAPGDTSDVLIPSTFVTRPSYVDLMRLIDEQDQEDQKVCSALKKEGKECAAHRTGVKVILWRDDIMWEWPLIDLAFVLLMLPSLMTLVTIIIHRFRMIRQRRRERAPEIAVLNLPCLIWRGNGQPWEKVEDAQMVGDQSGTKDSNTSQNILSRTSAQITSFWNRLRGEQRRQDMELGGNNEEGISSPSADEAGPSTLPATSSANGTIKPLKTVPVAPPAPPPDRTYYSCDECAICLSDFVDGDLVRVLPCGHVFHLPEIDSWLTRVKKFCPICKRDITVLPPPAPPIPGTNAAATPSSTASMVPNEEQENETESLLVPDRQV